MDITNSSLSKAFMEDHRDLTQGFAQILLALRVNDLQRAALIAERLDRTAGPHIEFEEKVLYPAVAKDRGGQYTARLYREHRLGVELLVRLMESKGKTKLEALEREKSIQDVQIVVDHALSCGTLLSHLTILETEEQEKLLKQLLDFRQAGHLWSQLAGSQT